MRSFLLVLGLSSLLPSCSSEVAPPRPEPFRISVSYLAPETCRVGFEGRTFDLSTEEEEALRSLRSRTGQRDATVEGEVNVPWRCIGAAIALAQRADYRAVAEPPTSPRR